MLTGCSRLTAFGDLADKAIAATMCGFDKHGRLWIIAKRVSQLTNSDFQNRVADKRLRPNGVEEFVFGYELSGTPDEMVENCERFWPELNNLRTPQQTFVRPVKAKVIEDYAVFVAQRSH